MNQAAHGDREHGFIMTRMRIARKVVVGFWQEESTHRKSAPGRAPPPPGTIGRREVRPVWR